MLVPKHQLLFAVQAITSGQVNDLTATQGQHNTESQAVEGKGATKRDSPGSREGWHLPDDTSMAL